MLREYEAFLIKKGTIKNQHVPYYLKWVSDCYGFLNELLSNRLNDDQKKQFLLNMAKRYKDQKFKHLQCQKPSGQIIFYNVLIPFLYLKCYFIISLCGQEEDC